MRKHAEGTCATKVLHNQGRCVSNQVKSGRFRGNQAPFGTDSLPIEGRELVATQSVVVSEPTRPPCSSDDCDGTCGKCCVTVYTRENAGVYKPNCMHVKRVCVHVRALGGFLARHVLQRWVAAQAVGSPFEAGPFTPLL